MDNTKLASLIRDAVSHAIATGDRPQQDRTELFELLQTKGIEQFVEALRPKIVASTEGQPSERHTQFVR
jgi:hypothetical protein